MPNVTMRLLCPFVVAALAIVSLPAGAAPRTFVASFGNDANVCSLPLPCRGFARALTQTDPGGEILVLDTAGYGAVTVDKAVSIIAPAGVYAGISATSGDGIVVNAPGAIVVLRGLDINGTGTSAGSGILHQAAASLLIDHCTVSGFANDFIGGDGATGIRILAGPVTIANSVVKNNVRGGISARGSDQANFVRVTVVNSRMENNGFPFGSVRDAGVAAIAGALVTVRDSVVAGNFRGFMACGAGVAEPLGGVLSVDNSLADRNGVGVFIGANNVACAIRVSNSTITDNSIFGIEQQGGSLVTSLGNNFVYSNAAAEVFGLTTTPK
jgi:hypothetical protein